jgi:hypothetical protein
LLTERWLLHVQTGRSARDVLFFSDGHKVAQMSKFHRNILIRVIATCVLMAMLQKEHELIVSISSLLQILSVSINVCKKWFNALFVTQFFHFASTIRTRQHCD